MFRTGPHERKTASMAMLPEIVWGTAAHAEFDSVSIGGIVVSAAHGTSSTGTSGGHSTMLLLSKYVEGIFHSLAFAC